MNVRIYQISDIIGRNQFHSCTVYFVRMLDDFTEYLLSFPAII